MNDFFFFLSIIFLFCFINEVVDCINNLHAFRYYPQWKPLHTKIKSHYEQLISQLVALLYNHTEEDHASLHGIASALRSKLLVDTGVDANALVGMVRGYLVTMDIHELMRVMHVTDDGEADLLTADTPKQQNAPSFESDFVGGQVPDAALSSPIAGRATKKKQSKETAPAKNAFAVLSLDEN